MPGDHLSYQSVRPTIPAQCNGSAVFDDVEVKLLNEYLEQEEIEETSAEVMGGASESDGDRDHESAVDGCSHDDEAAEYPDQTPVQ